MRAGRGRALAGREAGQKVIYLSTEASDPVAATLERATFIPALQKAPFLGGDDFLGAARERIFLFTHGQTGRDNPEAQGLSHLITDGQAVEDANLSDKKLLDTLANRRRHAQRRMEREGGPREAQPAPGRRERDPQPRRPASRPAHRSAGCALRCRRLRHQLPRRRLHRGGASRRPSRPRPRCAGMRRAPARTAAADAVAVRITGGG